MSRAARICTLCALRCGDFAANFSSNSVLKFEPIFKIYFQKRGKFDETLSACPSKKRLDKFKRKPDAKIFV